MRIEEVPYNLVNRIWPFVEQYIAKALPHANGEYTIEEVRVLVSLGQWALIVAMDDDNVIHGAATVQYFNRPRDRVAFVTAAGGRCIATSENAAQLYDIFRANGATAVEAAARDSAARLWKKLGFSVKYNIISATL